MTTLTIEIDKDKDLSAVTEFISKLGLKYEVEEQDELIYSDELKQMLDERYKDYKEGRVKMISEEESREQIQQLLSSKK